MGLPGEHPPAVDEDLPAQPAPTSSAIASAIGIVFILSRHRVRVCVYSRLTRRIERYSTVTGKAYRPRVMRIGAFRYVAAVAGLAVPGDRGHRAVLRHALGEHSAVLRRAQRRRRRAASPSRPTRTSSPHRRRLTALVNTLLLTLAAPTITMLHVHAGGVVRGALADARQAPARRHGVPAADAFPAS